MVSEKIICHNSHLLRIKFFKELGYINLETSPFQVLSNFHTKNLQIKEENLYLLQSLIQATIMSANQDYSFMMKAVDLIITYHVLLMIIFTKICNF